MKERGFVVCRSMSLPGGVPNGDLPSAFGRKRPREDDGKHKN